MILFPPAKINLGLKVLKKREDGFHEIDTCMVAIPLTDVLEIIPSETFIFKQTGLTVDGDQESNLCVKAFRLFQDGYDIPNAYIHLRKQLPMGAGLGGGSADASYVLKGLNAIFDKGLTDDQLREMASELGSDCPFFISDSVQLGRGRGTELTPFDLDLSGYFLKVINPEIHVGTKEAYAGITFSGELNGVEEVLKKPIAEWKDLLKNDFEPSIFKNYPVIEELKHQLYQEGAVYASMSGSGSTVFGIFEERPIITTDFYEQVLEM
ncbi:MAG: 4-(cytidine 5'-diphospho)-2-C-methyl-D-erythritol kinase [Crocinitomicaceae bacterium]